MKHFFIILVSLVGLIGFSQKEEKPQLNITFLLDLSDRISTQKNPNTPEHYQRDLGVIKEITKIFKDEIKNLGLYKAKGRMRVIFTPIPRLSSINQKASELMTDLSQYSFQETSKKKEIYKNITEKYQENLNKIYMEVIKNNEYLGSDIWRFFKNDVKNMCIANDGNYRNILVILTDGYLYHKQSQNEKKGNRTATISPISLEKNKLRTPNWRKTFDEKDFGYITERKDLQDLEVLVLEVSPSQKHIQDEDVIRAYLEKWFKEMNVKRFEIHNTNLPANTKILLKNYFNK